MTRRSYKYHKTTLALMMSLASTPALTNESDSKQEHSPKLSDSSEYGSSEYGSSEYDGDIQESIDHNQQSGLLPQFLFGMAKGRSPLAPPAAGTVIFWSYRFDIGLGYVFCRLCDLKIYTGVEGSLSYPVRLSNDIGKPIQQVGGKALARIHYAEHQTMLSAVALKGSLINGISAQVSQIQYTRYSLWSFIPSLEAGIELSAKTQESSFLGAQTFSALLIAGASGFIGQYSSSETKPFDRNDQANIEQLQSTLDWKAQGAVNSWEATGILTWIPFQQDTTQENPATANEANPSHAVSSHSVGASVTYRESNFNKLLLRGGKKSDIIQQEWIFQLIWQKQIDE
jgi:hypothetical protein